MPRRTVGRVSVQRSLAWNFIADFNWRWNSTIPLATGWCRGRCVPSIALIWLNSLYSICVPSSMQAGVPNWDIQSSIKAFAAVSALMLTIGKASGQHVYLSMQVRQYLFPFKLGSRPTKSICTYSNLMHYRVRSRAYYVPTLTVVTVHSFVPIPDTRGRSTTWQNIA